MKKKIKEKKEEVLGRCKRCGRILKNPDAVKVGYGHCCFRKLFIVKLKPLWRKDEPKQKVNKPNLRRIIKSLSKSKSV